MSGIGFQSTHPYRVRLHALPRIARSHLFQSTHPYRVRRAIGWTWVRIGRFNPRTHIGCDSLLTLQLAAQRSFQSTHPYRVRLNNMERKMIIKSFNPRTHIGCDGILIYYIYVEIGFNPRTHIGCDVSDDKHRCCRSVSIHAPI